ncbi:hypothetical protein BS612_06900 [Listeria monocytogenes]|nr:hypothetical protein BS612_06900 [Listeria monocytogenes]
MEEATIQQRFQTKIIESYGKAGFPRLAMKMHLLDQSETEEYKAFALAKQEEDQKKAAEAVQVMQKTTSRRAKRWRWSCSTNWSVPNWL